MRTTIETKNLVIRPTVFEDCVKFAEWETRPEVTEFFSIDDGRTYEDVVTEYIKAEYDNSKMYLTITRKLDGKMLGRIILTRIDTLHDSLDITRIYIADVSERNKGYGSEALRGVLEYAFLNLHTERVTIDHFITNRKAAMLYEKLGFKNEGIMRHASKKNGKYYDLQLKSMTRAEYLDSIHTMD
ncbi:MAG: GNAT family N-acetyltransferase [Eubacterium sp.]|jgi:ribosomal-protein-alanine N-acetyltransferase